jgi:hypothetical protein
MYQATSLIKPYPNFTYICNRKLSVVLSSQLKAHSAIIHWKDSVAKVIKQLAIIRVVHSIASLNFISEISVMIPAPLSTRHFALLDYIWPTSEINFLSKMVFFQFIQKKI